MSQNQNLSSSNNLNINLDLQNNEINNIKNNSDGNEKEDSKMENNNFGKQEKNINSEIKKENHCNPLAYSGVNHQKKKKSDINVLNTLKKKFYNNDNNDLTINNSIPKENYNNNNNNEEINKLKNDLLDNNIQMLRTCLINYGETSYLNAILQCIGNIVYLKDFFTNKDTEEYIYNNAHQKNLAFVTQRLFKHIYIKKDEKYSIESFLRVLGNLNKVYNGKKSRNANECLTFILDTLHSELNRSNNNIDNNDNKDINNKDRDDFIKKKLINYKNKYDSTISDYFNWLDLKEYHCTQCGEITYDLKTYNSLQLDILEFYDKIRKKEITICDCLSYEMQKKKESYCYSCKNKGKFHVISEIYSSPKIFVFLLDSGVYNEKLLKVNFILEEEIDLNKFVEDKNSPKKYELIGMVAIAKDKNYNSFIKSIEDKHWYFFYNESVKQCEIDEIKSYLKKKQLIPTILIYKDLE